MGVKGEQEKLAERIRDYWAGYGFAVSTQCGAEKIPAGSFRMAQDSYIPALRSDMKNGLPAGVKCTVALGRSILARHGFD